MSVTSNAMSVLGTYKQYLDWRAIFVLPILLIVIHYATRDPRRKSLPPMVKGWLIINQTFLQLKDDPTGLLRDWAREYGELFMTKSGTTTFIWLNSMESVKELFDRRSNIYSDRQPMPMALDAASGGNRVTFMRYGKRWRTVRGILHKLLTPNMAKSYAPIQTFEAKKLSVDLLDSPENFYMHNRRYSASTILNITYGRRIPQWDCEEIRKIYAVLERFSDVRRPGAYLVDAFPSLANFPLFDLFSNWRKVGNEYHKRDYETYKEFWDTMVKEIEQGKAQHSFGREFVQSDYKAMGVDEVQAAYICGAMIEAGSETTSAMLNNAIIGLLSNPSTIDAAHEELDRVVGKDRTPNFDDEPNLPYMRAIIKELLRWRPINKLGNNHYVVQDDWYNGFFIPKNSVIMANWWAIHYDERYYPDPFTFKPERFMNSPILSLSAAASAAHPDPLMRDHLTYGGGRRICGGIHVAERSLFLVLSRLLWGFDLGLAKDAEGKDIPVDFTLKGVMPGATSVAKPYKCSIKVRSKQHERLFRQEWKDAERNGIQFEEINFAKLVGT